MGRTNLTTHGCAIAFRAVADHLNPFAGGGTTLFDNLVTACYPCNFGKANFTLADLALEGPRPPLLDGWDGLELLLPALKALARAPRSA